ALEELEEGPERHRGQEKRHAKPGGVGDEQADAALDGARSSGQGQDRPEDRAHTRRPADREGEPDDEGTDVAGGFLAELELLGAAEEADTRQPRDVEAEYDDEETAGPTDPVAVLEEKRTGGAEGRPHRDKDDREPEHEGYGVEHHFSPRRRGQLSTQVRDRDTGDESEVRRQERQHTWGEEQTSPAVKATRTPSGSAISESSLPLRPGPRRCPTPGAPGRKQ